MPEIRTKQTRTLSSKVGPLKVKCTFIDQSASLETWIDNCAILAAELKVPVTEIHAMLFAQLPEIFGR